MKHWVKHLLMVIAIILLIPVCVCLWYANQIKMNYSDSGVKSFEIVMGDSTSDIVNSLIQKGLVKNYNVAMFYILTHHIVFMPGTFTVPNTFTMAELLQMMTKEKIKENQLTIPEGWTKEQIADALVTHNLSPSAFLSLAKDDEGMLFPDTYSLDGNTTESDVIQKMLDRYKQKTDSLGITKDNLILASIVEREAKNDTDRPIIAAIYLNRLRIGMALEADPTVQYAKYTDLGKAPVADGKKNYWAAITKEDYSGVKSPYNTYLNPGLPPGPICNPGVKSMAAVKSPASTSALFFFHTSDGKIITSKTLAEHNANKAKYLK